MQSKKPISSKCREFIITKEECTRSTKICVLLYEGFLKDGDQVSDKQLLLQLQDHSQDALELLMQKYSPYLYTVITYILGRVGSPEDIEELMQDSFYAVWNHAENIHGNLKAYLRTTARNKAASWLRSHRELPMAFDYIEIPIDSNSLEDVILQEELSQYIQHALCRMHSKDREIFLRYYYYLQNTAEISECMGIPAGTVSSRLSRGRSVLRKSLGKEHIL